VIINAYYVIVLTFGWLKLIIGSSHVKGIMIIMVDLWMD
jgi:hypothetical protein